MFFKRFRKKTTKLDETFLNVTKEIKALDDSDNPALIRKYIMESCEHIVSLAKEVEGFNFQIAQIEEYRADVTKIQTMSIENVSRIRDTITNIINLTHKKQNFEKTEKKLEDDAFILMQENEDNIVSDIRRIEENEKYYSKIDKDVKNLEATKNSFEIEKEELLHQMKICQRISIVIFTVAVAAVLASFIIPGGFTSTFRLIFLSGIFVLVFIAFIIFLYTGTKRKEYREVIKLLNQTISLLNVERMRLVNIKKALDFELNYYDVVSSAELTYIWEQYLISVREKEAERRNNIDLAYYIDRMYQILKDLDLKFEKRWVSQVNLFQNDDDLKELADKLDERIGSLKAVVYENNNSIDIERAEIDRLMKNYDFYVPEVMEILAQVDRITGKSMIRK